MKEAYEESMTKMQVEIDDLKKRLKSLESTLEQNRLEWAEEREKHKESWAAKKKAEAMLKSEVQQLNEILKQSKDRDAKQSNELNAKTSELRSKVKELEMELEAKKQATAAQELTFRVIQERLGNIY